MTKVKPKKRVFRAMEAINRTGVDWEKAQDMLVKHGRTREAVIFARCRGDLREIKRLLVSED